MKTMEELKVQLQNASTLEDRTAIRIKMIELNRLSGEPDSAINCPISTFLNDMHRNQSIRIPSLA